MHRVGGANGLSADLHEFLITPEGTALMTMYEVVEHDITDFPDYHQDEEHPEDPSYIWDCIFQEIGIDTGALIYEWRASEHVNINTTYRGIGPGGSKDDPFDWFHINSIEKDESGNYLISSRYTHSIMYIDGKSGDVLWTLGGRMNDFMDLSGGNATNFAWQHDARFLPADTFPNMYHPPAEREGYATRLVTLFDNAAEDQHYEYGLVVSRSLLLEVTYPTTTRGAMPTLLSDLHGKVKREDELDRNQRKVLEINGTDSRFTARVIKSYENPLGVRSSSQGSVQILPQGPGKDPKVFVGYGLNAVWTEFDTDGSVLCDVHYGATTSWERGDIQSYRIYKLPWVGAPEVPPAVDISDDDAEVYVSWNGATEVTDWVLQCSDEDTEDEKAWADVVRVRKDDFETAILIPEDTSESRYLRVIALDRYDRRLDYGTSETIDRGEAGADVASFTHKVTHEVASASSFRMFVVLMGTVATSFFLFEAYRRYLSWKSGRPSAGPLMWRSKSTYRLLGEA